MLRARLPLSRVLVLCSGWFEVRWVRDDSIGSGLDRFDASPGVSCFPFYRPRESTGYSGGKEKKQEKESGLQDHQVLLRLHAGPADTIDVDRHGSMSWTYPSLVPCAGVVC